MAPRHSAGEFSNVRGAISSSTCAGMPMSASTMLPQCSRPGMSRCPGFLRKNVTVRSARTARPRTSPVAPSTPDGISTAITGIPDPFSAATSSPAGPSTARDSPAPNTASTARCCPSSTSGTAGTTSPSQRPAITAASPFSASRSPRSATFTGQPASARSRAATNPSPPLLPGPASTTSGRGLQRSMIARATARPAVSIRSSDATPCATASRSALAISSGRRSAALKA
jgi:hypothetical protein